MKALFLILIFQFLILTVCASELSISDSILIKNSTSFDISLILKSLVKKGSLQSKQFTKTKLVNLRRDLKENNISDFIKIKDSTDIKELFFEKIFNKKPKKNRGKLFAVLTFLGGITSSALGMGGIVTLMSLGMGGISLLVASLAFALFSLLLGYMASIRLTQLADETQKDYHIYHFLIAVGFYSSIIVTLYSFLAILLILTNQL